MLLKKRLMPLEEKLPYTFTPTMKVLHIVNFFMLMVAGSLLLIVFHRISLTYYDKGTPLGIVKLLNTLHVLFTHC